VSIPTSGSIEIAAPPDRVFQWLVDPDRIEQWLGRNVTLMPANPADLRVGYRNEGTYLAPDGDRKIELEITAYDPPREFAFRLNYDGGKADTRYTVTPDSPASRLEASSTTDYAAVAVPTYAAARQAARKLKEQGVPWVVRVLAWIGLPLAYFRVRRKIKKYDAKLNEAYRSGDDEAVRKGMQEEFDATLATLKQLVEAE